MNLLLDVISPIPEFTVFDDNKIIHFSKIIQSKEEKLSDSIIPVYQTIDKNLNFNKNLRSLIVTTGPGSYTSLRVGLSFALGLHFSKGLKIAGLSSEDLLKFVPNNITKKNYGIYFESANNQKFVCYKFVGSSFKYLKIEENQLNELKVLNNIDLIYYNFKPLNCSLFQLQQKKYLIKEKIVKNFNQIKFGGKNLLKPIYISNNKILN
tara:strand:+ start:814 stop:1437 length:624 start_codon:yes stop_codon:yes gene_type:complete